LNEKQSASVPAKPRKPTTAFALSLTAGILVLIQGIVRLLQSRALEVSGVADEIRGRIFVGIALHIIGAVALLFAVLIIVGAILMYQTPMRMTGALLVLVFSILSILTGGLFGWLGFILGTIGSVIALAKK
jgi:hypothetical protein